MHSTIHDIYLFHVWISFRARSTAIFPIPDKYIAQLVDHAQWARKHEYPKVKLLLDKNTISATQVRYLPSLFQDRTSPNRRLVDILDLRDFLKKSGVEYIRGDNSGNKISAYDLYIEMYERFRQAEYDYLRDCDSKKKLMMERLIANMIDLSKIVALQKGFHHNKKTARMLCIDFNVTLSWPIIPSGNKASALSYHLKRIDSLPDRDINLNAKDFSIIKHKGEAVYDTSAMLSCLSVKNNFFSNIKVSAEYLKHNRLSDYIIRMFQKVMFSSEQSFPTSFLDGIRKHTLTGSDGIFIPSQSDKSWIPGNLYGFHFSAIYGNRSFLSNTEFECDKSCPDTPVLASCIKNDLMDHEIELMKYEYVMSSFAEPYYRNPEHIALKLAVLDEYNKQKGLGQVSQLVEVICKYIKQLESFVNNKYILLTRSSDIASVLDEKLNQDIQRVRKNMCLLSDAWQKRGTEEGDNMLWVIHYFNDLQFSDDELLRAIAIAKREDLYMVHTTYPVLLEQFIHSEGLYGSYQVLFRKYPCSKEAYDQLEEQYKILKEELIELMQDSRDAEDYIAQQYRIKDIKCIKEYDISNIQGRWEKIINKVLKYHSCVYLVFFIDSGFDMKIIQAQLLAMYNQAIEIQRSEKKQLEAIPSRACLAQTKPELSDLLDSTVHPVDEGKFVKTEDLQSVTLGEVLVTSEVSQDMEGVEFLGR
ncbi:MAG: hypothetical protein P857_1060 [Candidatus Xenolissoclinum pacificiensis L6]|uniref:Uncharacterized protein n=1 Tax=Candidatus Xenolissoclinum pacificiensis L6 TaxID=1401685 RepID=W2V193_9RICK|nr:MAG: hypothetical protein P857_1060 [Candidatus Xenolissoclinum pacificiensis L6]